MTISESPATGNAPVAIRLAGVSKSFGRRSRRVVALDDITMTVRQGEFVSIVGRSGSGKSTLLDLIAGLTPADSGVIELAGRRVGIMFQDANLFPWLTARANVELALKLSGVARRDRAARADELLAIVGLHGRGSLRPHVLSGGMRQRVALARALAQDCEILLMDEPFSALDAITRGELHIQVGKICLDRELTVVLVTHDIGEASLLSDHVIVLGSSPGSIRAHVDVHTPRPRDSEDPGVHEAIVKLAADLVEVEAPRG